MPTSTRRFTRTPSARARGLGSLTAVCFTTSLACASAGAHAPVAPHEQAVLVILSSAQSVPITLEGAVDTLTGVTMLRGVIRATDPDTITLDATSARVAGVNQVFASPARARLPRIAIASMTNEASLHATEVVLLGFLLGVGVVYFGFRIFAGSFKT
jgi:hypothetical protein